MKKSGFSTRDISYISLGAVFFIICSWICVPSPIPFTMQNFGIVFASLVLGRRRAFFSYIIYLLCGFVGLPVFAGFKSGLGVMSGPTGGYIIGMLSLPIIIGRNLETKPRSIFLELCVCAAAMLILYSFGTAWYILFSKNTNGILPILSACVFPFVIPDAIKCIIAVLCTRKFRYHTFRH